MNNEQHQQRSTLIIMKPDCFSSCTFLTSHAQQSVPSSPSAHIHECLCSTDRLHCSVLNDMHLA